VSLLGAETVRVGKPLQGAELGALAERLVSLPEPLDATVVDLPDGRTLRVAGVAAHEDDPAILLIEDVTVERRRERVVREFVRNAAHQLRTPLAGIVAAVEVLQSGAKDVPGDRDRFLGHVAEHATRLTRVARALLMLARAESGESVTLERIDVHELLRTLAAEAGPEAVARIDVACPGSLTALAQPDLLHEALAALLENAVRHTRGPIRLVGRQLSDAVELEVADSGEGIDPEHRPRIFEPFYRVSETGTGFGLGLAIARQAVEAMQGELSTTAHSEAGTVFTIRLPAR
jgi:two-component system, OmpR family, phosphate regulon sensor histidine kinase PhoR